MSKTKWSILDTLFILFTSITILLLIFWIVGQIRGLDTFNQLPDWLVGLTDKIWGFLISSGLSILTYWLKSKHKHSPNYLLWTLITTSFLLALVIGVSVAFNTISPQPDTPQTGEIKFQLAYENAPVQLSFAQKAPKGLQQNIVPQDNGYFQVQKVNLPSVDENFYAKANKKVKSSEYKNSAVQKSIEICFTRIKSELSEDGCIAVLESHVFNHFRLGKNDPGCVRLCNDQTSNRFSFSNLFTSAYALSPALPQAYAGWTVPNLETLNSKREYGFSQVSIESLDLPQNLKEANNYTKAIYVNDTPIYFDGFLPEDLNYPFQYDNGIDLEFGLENLNFSGKHNGYENLKVVISFYKNDQFISATNCNLHFVALRTIGPYTISSSDSARFQWKAKYKTSAKKEYEIFNYSTTDLNVANRKKNMLDHANLKYKDYSLVGVVRPPLNDNKNYGVVIGLVLPSKQIKFTFSDQEEKALLKWMKLQNNSVFETSAYPFPLTGDK
ncbi:MAG TPA: hypothetical protein VKA27_00705 [Sunxiuqinia sp.]|nr:hypothetical protein [Sunxiuqinia sp.]